MIFADKLILLRKKAGWSQEELAEQMDVTRQSVSKWEGAQSVPDLDKMIRLSELFGVSTDYLLCLTNSPEPPSAENPLTEEEALLVDVYRKCSAAGRFRIIQFCMNECSQADEGNPR